jgi:hypothetical protein
MIKKFRQERKPVPLITGWWHARCWESLKKPTCTEQLPYPKAQIYRSIRVIDWQSNHSTLQHALTANYNEFRNTSETEKRPSYIVTGWELTDRVRLTAGAGVCFLHHRVYIDFWVSCLTRIRNSIPGIKQPQREAACSRPRSVILRMCEYLRSIVIHFHDMGLNLNTD